MMLLLRAASAAAAAWAGRTRSRLGPRLVCGVGLALALSPSAQALDLGRLTLHPVGEQFQARIEVMDAAGLRPGEVVFRIAPAEVYRVAQRQLDPQLAQAKLSVRMPRRGPPTVLIDGLVLPPDRGVDLLVLIGQGGVAGMREYRLSRDTLDTPVVAVDPAARTSMLSRAAPRGTALRQANAAFAARAPSAAASAPLAAQGPVSKATTEAVTQALNGWAKAWSARDVAGYLAHYTDDFTNSPKLSRSAWEAQRRERLLARQEIEVALSELRLEPKGADMQVTLIQNYRGDSLRQTSRKVLTLVRHGEQWLISKEMEVNVR